VPSGRREARHLLAVGRWATVGWALVLTGGALSFGSPDQPVVELALSIASITYGGLLGTYILGGISRRVRQRDAIVAIATASVGMLIIAYVYGGSLSLSYLF